MQGSAPPIFIVWEWWEIEKKNNQLIIHSFLVKFQLIRENELIDISARLSTITYQVLWSWIISFLLGIVVYFATYFYEHLHTISHIFVFYFLTAFKRRRVFTYKKVERLFLFGYWMLTFFQVYPRCSQQNDIRIIMLSLIFYNMIVLVIYSARLLRCFDILWNDSRFWQLLSYSFPFKRKFHLAITLFYHVVKFKLYMYAIITFLDLGKKYII